MKICRNLVSIKKTPSRVPATNPTLNRVAGARGSLPIGLYNVNCCCPFLAKSDFQWTHGKPSIRLAMPWGWLRRVAVTFYAPSFPQPCAWANQPTDRRARNNTPPPAAASSWPHSTQFLRTCRPAFLQVNFRQTFDKTTRSKEKLNFHLQTGPDPFIEVLWSTWTEI